MTPERYERIGRLFDAALERPLEERSAYLDHACGADAEMRSDVDKLLARQQESGDFLSRPAIEVAAQLLSQDHAQFAPGKRISHYQVLSRLGAGGMGEVYLAEDTRLKRKVALKVLPEAIAGDSDRLRRFEQEAFAASALNHPNILTIYEFGAEGATHYLAAEFIDGQTLRGRLQREPISIETALDIAIQAAQALSTAHQAFIIHRDIKPENVIIRNDGIVKVLDFGLAKLIEAEPVGAEPVGAEAETRMQVLTQAGTIVGTVAYMSPEQARGKTLDARSDIFSLGVVLYEMLAGRHPFLGETMSHTMVSILEKEVPPLANVVKDIPPEIEQITGHALAKKPDDRYQSAAELLADLKALHKRLEFAAQLENPAQDPVRTEPRGPMKPAQDEIEAATQIIQVQSTEPDGKRERIPERRRGVTASRSARLWALGGVVVLILLGVAVWRWPSQRPQPMPGLVTTTVPERSLIYSLTVQKYRDKKPYQAEFQALGREIFEGGWQFRLNLVSSQEGFLYLLNQEPDGAFRLIFPSTSRDNGSAHLASGERFQSDWYVFDNQKGKERFRVVWAERSVHQLEALRELVNKTTKGLISDPAQIQAVREFLQQNEASQIDIAQDQQTKQTSVRGSGPVLVTLIELEHQ
jgi:serine/threonine protein kinase